MHTHTQKHTNHKYTHTHMARNVYLCCAFGKSAPSALQYRNRCVSRARALLRPAQLFVIYGVSNSTQCSMLCVYIYGRCVYHTAVCVERFVGRVGVGVCILRSTSEQTDFYKYIISGRLAYGAKRSSAFFCVTYINTQYAFHITSRTTIHNIT